MNASIEYGGSFPVLRIHRYHHIEPDFNHFEAVSESTSAATAPASSESTRFSDSSQSLGGLPSSTSMANLSMVDMRPAGPGAGAKRTGSSSIPSRSPFWMNSSTMSSVVMRSRGNAPTLPSPSPPASPPPMPSRFISTESLLSSISALVNFKDGCAEDSPDACCCSFKFLETWLLSLDRTTRLTLRFVSKLSGWLDVSLFTGSGLHTPSDGGFSCPFGRCRAPPDIFFIRLGFSTSTAAPPLVGRGGTKLSLRFVSSGGMLLDLGTDAATASLLAPRSSQDPPLVVVDAAVFSLESLTIRSAMRE
mmetsp:Transcript_23606/g.52716  ORF Transcript_23606/g.52716 Transcript_23606/m.52716 type:complete len:305 (+) Transcript_23606:2-916(+)